MYTPSLDRRRAVAAGAVRLIYRLTHPRAPLPDDIPAIQRLARAFSRTGRSTRFDRAADCGWIATSAYRAPILVFWLFELPPIWHEDIGLLEMMFVVHRSHRGRCIALLICVHIGAALYHHFVLKDAFLGHGERLIAMPGTRAG